MTTLTIKVEQKHIDAGGTDAECCPIHHACVDAGLGGDTAVYEQKLLVSETGKDYYFFLPLPQVAQDFIRLNDCEDVDRSTLKPFEFEVEIPESEGIGLCKVKLRSDEDDDD